MKVLVYLLLLVGVFTQSSCFRQNRAMSLAMDELHKGNYAAGMITAAVVGYIAIKTMILVVKKKKYIIFSIYCMAARLLAVCGYFFMK